MASADINSPRRHLDERPPDIPRSPPRRERDRDGRRDDRPPPRREGADKYRPSGSGRPPKRERTPPPEPTEEQKQAAAKAEYEKLLTARSGGVYVPPARLRALQAQITDRTSKEYQRMAWEALKKSINGLINKVNVSNIKHIVPELFGENLVRGRGLFCQSIMKAQAASLPFTPIYAAMAAIVNTKLPNVGDLLVKRLVLRFRKAFKRNDKAVCLSTTTFLAHLVNQQVVHYVLAAQVLLLLLNKPTDDSVEVAVGLSREVGQFLEEMDGRIANVVFDQFRNILHEADIDKRVQYMIEVLFQVRKDKFKDNPAVKEELDLVEEEDQITHEVELDGNYDNEDVLNVFKYDAKWEENETAYKQLKSEILGEGSDDEDAEDEDESSDEEEDEEEKTVEIKDQSNTDLVNLRRTIFLTLQSSIDPEECVHRLMKLNLPPGKESELPSMIIESCSQDKTYSKFYGTTGEILAKVNRLWMDLFEQAFAQYYDTIFRYETNKLRNIARFFGAMFSTNALPWHCFSVIHLNEEETTSASRIFVKILFQDLAEALGMKKLQARLQDPILKPSLEGLFPRDNPRNLRFSINYFTSIGMGALTEEMREYLQNMPKPALPAPAAADRSDSESVSSYSSYTGSSYSSRSRSRSRSISRSRSPRRVSDRKRSYSESRTPPARGRERGRSYTRSRSSSHSYSSDRSLSPPPRRNGGGARRADRSASYSRSRSPPPGRRGRDRVRSPPDSVSHSRGRSPLPRGGEARSVSYDTRDRSMSSRGRSITPSRTPSPSRSRTPTRRRRAASSPHRSLTRSRSLLSRGRPPPSRGAGRRSSPGSRSPSPPRAARGRPSSYSRSPARSPARSPPTRRRRRNSSSEASSGPRKKYRRSS